MNNGWIKLHRKFIDSPLWCYAIQTNNSTLIQVWFHLLLSANYEEKKWYDGKKEIVIPVGSLITSYASVAENVGSSIQTVRTCLKHIENMNMITRTSTNKWTQVWIVNWAKYQSGEDAVNTQAPKEITGDQQTTNKRLTTTKERKNIRKRERDDNETLQLINQPEYLLSIPLSDLPSLMKDTSASESDVRRKAEMLHGWYLGNPRRNSKSNWKATLRNALLKDYPQVKDTAFGSYVPYSETVKKGAAW